uniref:Putative secreted mucin n=1 Tax=Amblyomma triste TaxID=251400 RepID=A0A023G1A1_AMBTT
MAAIVLALALLSSPCSIQASTDLSTSGEELPTTTSPTTTAQSPEGSCGEASMPNILGLNQCLGSSLDLCTESNTPFEGIRTLINCTVTSVFRNLSPKGAMSAFGRLVGAITFKISPMYKSIIFTSEELIIRVSFYLIQLQNNCSCIWKTILC